MTLSRSLAASLVLTAAACSHAQQTDATPPVPPPVKKPAPIVRATPPAAKPADATADTPPAPRPIHLTQAKPVQTDSDSTQPAPAPVKPTKIAPAKPSTSAAPVAPTPAKPASASPTPPAPATTTVAINRSVIVLDAAHGGGDTGSRINDSLTEKDVTLNLAFHLRSLLAARGFNVIMTRSGDAASNAPGEPGSLNERAGTANHARAAACLLLHATSAGQGVHLYTSELTPIAAEPVAVPWLQAQAAWVPQSQKLATQLATALSRGKIPVVKNSASIRPVDSLTCPAVVVELAPEKSDAASLSNDRYQQRVAEAIATALVFWQNQAVPPQRALPPPPTVAAPATNEVQP